MNRIATQTPHTVELGVASAATQGSFTVLAEPVGYDKLIPGISND